ncbi:HIT domain-containing protein [Pseudomonas aeruginosa]|nr:HIT domain-containing protein [Pseudomonas aeruginosa]HBN8615556.1 HIT domain-containing protein [Pseudomonas aeruginosa]HBO3332282.1 HIT domain-containing protein [Pseudomonas aeruginosa]
MSSCSYCSEFSGDREGSYYLRNIFTEINCERIYLESDRFVVYPSVGALVVGHLLVVPKNHYTALSLSEPDELVELRGVILDIEKIHGCMQIQSGDSFIFEHGILDVDQSLMNCVDHAHLHVLPFSVDAASLPFLNFIELNLEDLSKFDSGFPDYIAYGASGRLFLSDDRDKHPQYLRKVLHDMLQLDGHWNWRSDPKIENIKGWITRFFDIVKNNKLQSLKLSRLRLIER